MARLLYRHVYPSVRLPGSNGLRRALLPAFQLAVLSGIALFVALAVVNTVLGTPPPEAPYRPYG